ncbi:MAG: hypothetical protein BRC32_00760 [Actinobacteria bacterium QS_8_72_14]|nr:MAG: hypothetical protein BRC32_00760 [Actinobacteria bacterium QS_8_72_14]
MGSGSGDPRSGPCRSGAVAARRRHLQATVSPAGRADRTPARPRYRCVARRSRSRQAWSPGRAHAVPTLSALPARPRRPTDPLTKALRIITPPPAAPSTATVAHGSIVQADVAVVGAGVGGLVTALDALEADPSRTVVVIDKGQAGASGSTPLAQGGMAAAVGPGDNAEAHANDTVAAGDGLADPDAAAVLATEAPDRVADLQRRGVRFDVEADGRWHLAQEGGQSRPRSVHVADHTGAAIFQALRDTATGQVTRLQGTAHALAVAGHAPRRVTGVWVLLDEIDACTRPRPTGRRPRPTAWPSHGARGRRWPTASSSSSTPPACAPRTSAAATMATRAATATRPPPTTAATAAGACC